MDTRDQLILNLLHQSAPMSSSQMHDVLSDQMSLATLKRHLDTLGAEKQIIKTGKAKSTRYAVSLLFELLQPIPVKSYFAKEIDERNAKTKFNFELLLDIIPAHSLFTDTELRYLQTLQASYLQKCAQLSATSLQKELERWAIDLSWKSSQIEGNTYSLLETELLLKEKQTAAGKSKEEAVMLLNHKETLDFIVQHPDFIAPLTVSNISQLHSLLVKDLEVGKNIRRSRVGITGTNYKPLDNEHQILEALQHLCTVVNNKANVFEKALLALVFLSYIQAFEDGNKRTARIVSNALLIHHNHCPLSFRTVDSVYFKQAMLLFYEQNNISAMKQIFIEQYAFAVETYF